MCVRIYIKKLTTWNDVTHTYDPSDNEHATLFSWYSPDTCATLVIKTLETNKTELNQKKKQATHI